MRRMPQARGTKAQARIDAFYELEAKAHTRFDDSRPQLTVKTERIGGKILELYNLCYRDLIDDYSYVFKRGEKIGIVGPNGVGKSTFLNLITERLKPTSGRVVVGQTIQFGYYTQAGMSAPDDRRVIDLVKDIAEEIEIEGGKSLSAHQFLTYFGFDGTTQYNYFGNLSGGEKRRLYLLQVLMANPNFLILDEPTNDLDIYTLQILEQFLQTYKGCLIIVSHDRSFMDHIVDHLLVFEGNGKIKDYHSNYTQYRLERQRKEREQQLEAREKKAADRTITESRTQPQKRKATYKEQKEYEALTSEIDALTAERATLERQLSDGSLSDPAAITNASTRIGELISLLDDKELRWLELDEIINTK
jgi:ATP-binding cassette subfamily F protein uup